MAARVHILSKELVKASNPTQDIPYEVKLSGLDQIYGESKFPMLFFFKNQFPSEINASLIPDLLKKSLSQTLTKFPCFAGEFNGYDSVICSNSGALFMTAEVDTTLSEAIHDTITMKIGTRCTLELIQLEMIPNKVPLAVQLTLFKCGGTTIGIQCSHRIADGSTVALFLKSWAAICHGENQLAVEAEFGLGYNMFPPIPNFPIQGTCIPDEETMGKKMVVKRFVFTNEIITGLKQLASSGPWQTQNPTRVEVVFAYIWKQILESSRSKATFVAELVLNSRPRFNPPLSKSAMGNFILSSPLPSTLDTEIDYEILVQQFRDAKNRFERLEPGFDCVKYCSEFMEAINKPEVWSCIFSSLCGFPMYDVDFGWGGPILICPKPIGLPTVLLMRPKFLDGIEAWISLAEEDMALLPKELLSLASQAESYINPPLQVNGIQHYIAAKPIKIVGAVSIV